jgi:hypothetical protein
LSERINSPVVGPVPHPQNARFKDIYRGRRAFVIGNGPSLASQDLTPLKGELLFTMNSFDRHPLCRELSPLHHFLADPYVNTGNPHAEELLARIEDGIGESLVFVPDWDPLESATLREWRAAERLWTVPTEGALATAAPRALDMTTSLPGVQSTSQLAMMVAAYMGCSPIYLLGLDSDWAASHNLDRHFYADPTSAGNVLSYQTILECSLQLFRGYANLWEYCQASGVEVYNCTAGGLLDVFPRRPFEDVVNTP